MFLDSIIGEERYPFFFPTQLIMVDDEKSYLGNLVFGFPVEFSHHLFHSPDKALSYIQEPEHWPHASNLMLSKCKYTDQISDIPFCLGSELVLKEICSKRRFNEISVVVVDYVMPHIDGISFCKYLASEIKRIILTGMGDNEKALDAFNTGQIHQYMLKANPYLSTVLTDRIKSYQRNYFKEMSHHLNQYLGVKHVLNEKALNNYFNSMLRQYGIVEYYLIYPHKFLCLDAKGNYYFFMFETKDSLQEHIDAAKLKQASVELIDHLEDGSWFPHFHTADFLYEKTVVDWQNYMHPVTKLGDYLCAVIESPWIPGFDKSDIFSYAHFKAEQPNGFFAA